MKFILVVIVIVIVTVNFDVDHFHRPIFFELKKTPINRCHLNTNRTTAEQFFLVLHCISKTTIIQ